MTSRPGRLVDGEILLDREAEIVELAKLQGNKLRLELRGIEAELAR